MRVLWQTIVRLVSFRAGGADMPYAPRLLAVLLAAVAALNILLDAAALVEDASPLWTALSVLIGALLLYLLLRVAGKAERFVQLAIAMNVVVMVFILGMIPAMLAMLPMPADPKLLNGVQVSLVLPVTLFGFWFLCVRAWLLREAFDTHFLSGFMTSLMLLFAEAVVTVALMKAFQ